MIFPQNIQRILQSFDPQQKIKDPQIFFHNSPCKYRIQGDTHLIIQ